MSTPQPSVVVADPIIPVRDGVAATLRDVGMRVAGVASTPEDAAALVSRHRPDLCLLEITPGAAGRDVTLVRRAAPACAVVVYTAGDGEDDLVDALRAGAAGWLRKEAALDRLPAVLHAILAGEVTIPRSMLAAVVAELRNGHLHATATAGGRRVPLTGREADVRRLAAEGATTQEIADRLGISPVTVRRHRSRLAAKLGEDG